VTAAERVAIKRAKRLHSGWTAEDILAAAMREGLLDHSRTVADVQAVIDGAPEHQLGQSRMEAV
jgi:hypothetical protein